MIEERELRASRKAEEKISICLGAEEQTCWPFEKTTLSSARR